MISFFIYFVSHIFHVVILLLKCHSYLGHYKAREIFEITKNVRKEFNTFFT